MKFKITEKQTREDMLAIMSSILEAFEKNGATQFAGTLYFNMYNDEEKMELTTKETCQFSDGIKQSINKPVNPEQFAEVLNIKHDLLPVSEAKMRQRLYEEAQYKAFEIERERREESIKLHQAYRLREKEAEDKFISFLCETHGIEVNDKTSRSMMFSSTAKVTQYKAMIRHLEDENLIPEEGYVWRASLKNEKGKVSKVEIYSPQLVLLKKYKKG